MREIVLDTETTGLDPKRGDRIIEIGALKIDTQGSELEILKGLGEYFPLMMKVEVQIISMYENVPNWGDLINHLYD